MDTAATSIELENIDSLLRTIDGLYQAELEDHPLFPETQEAIPNTDMPNDFFTGNLYSKAELEEAGFIEPQIAEITLGLEMNLPVEKYARTGYNWQQMREIRRGIQVGIDTSVYENPLFGVNQMRELRMGLINHVDVSPFANLMLSAADMHKIRMELSEAAYRRNPFGYSQSFFDENSGLLIRISSDCMCAYISLSQTAAEPNFSINRLKKILAEHEITCGLLEQELEQFCKMRHRNSELLIAHGTKPESGSDGYYEFFFNDPGNAAPSINPDGSIDYSNLKVTEIVQAGQKLAVYHPATKGQTGSTVTGIVLLESDGQDLPALTGEGIEFDPETHTYQASHSGNVILQEKDFILSVWKSYTIEGDVTRYSGNIECDGTVFVRGDVLSMSRIKATGDIVIDGSVEGAELTSGHNILIRKGVNAANKGAIRAKGTITGNFFESANLYAEGSVEANYFLDCTIDTNDKIIARGGKSLIQGGTLHAALGVEARYYRAYGGAKTTIEAGDYMRLLEKQCANLKAMKLTTDEIKKLQDAKVKLEQLLSLDAEKYHAIYQRTLDTMEQKELHMEHLQHEKDLLAESLQNSRKAYIKVIRSIQAGILIIINGRKKRLSADMGLSIFTTESFPEEE